MQCAGAHAPYHTHPSLEFIRAQYTCASLLATKRVALTHGILSSPLPGCLLISLPVSLVNVCNLRHQRVVWVGVCQQGADGQQHLHSGIRWSGSYREIYITPSRSLKEEKTHSQRGRRNAAIARKVYLGNCESWTPLLLQDVQANTSLAVDVGMVHLRLELHLGRLERVVRWEVYHDKEDTARIGTVTRPHDCCLQYHVTKHVCLSFIVLALCCGQKIAHNLTKRRRKKMKTVSTPASGRDHLQRVLLNKM